MSLTSPVDICNLALSHLALPQITNIETPTTNSETICSQYYDIARQTLYRDAFFQFSIAQIQLPQDTSIPTFLYSKQSTELPQTIISFIYLFRDSTIYPNNGQYYRLYGNRIQTDLEAPYNVLYIKDIKDVNKMSAEFKMLLSYYLATLIAESLGSSTDKKQAVYQAYTQSLSKAISNNGIDNIPTVINSSSYIDSFVGMSTGSDNW